MNFCDLPSKESGSIFFAGIGGISMSSLAMVLQRKGYLISGYDRTRTDITSELESNGINICYDQADMCLDNVKAAVFSAALKDDNPVMQALKKANVPIYKRAELLGAIASLYECSIGVAGTHGKSTTSGMLSHIFLGDKDRDPTVIVGAVIRSISSTYRLGDGRDFIFEADEYTDSFLNFFPRIAVVLNVTLDHTDYFADLDAIVKSFSAYISNTGSDGFAVINADSQGALRAADGYAGTLVKYSVYGDNDADYKAENIVFHGGFAEFDVIRADNFYFRAKLAVPGEHNIGNALASIVCCDLCGLPVELIKSGIETYTGVSRRFEYRGKYRGADVYDDYAHHPDEVNASIKTAKSMNYERVIAVFQPHTYTRFRDLFDDFAASFVGCDIAVINEIYSAREANTLGISSKQLADMLDNGVYCESFEKIESYLHANVNPCDCILIMGAGNITDFSKQITTPVINR